MTKFNIVDQNYRQLRDALFHYFLWSLPVGTPVAEIGKLTDLVAWEAEALLDRYKKEEEECLKR